MTAVDMRLASKGRSEPRDGLAQQAKVHVALAKSYAAALADSGWSADDTADLETNIGKLETAVGGQAKAYDDAGSAAKAESVALDAAKAFIRKLRNALPRALRESPGASVTAESFHAGETLGRSTPKISKYLTTIRPAVEALDPALSKHFGGKSAVAELDAVKAALDTTGVAQESAWKGAPAQTLALYELMGKVLEQIEDLNRAGRSAFDGDAPARAKFNKDVLLRARQTRKKAEDPNDGKGGGGTPT